MACVISRFYRVASCIFLCAVVFYAPGFVSALTLPEWTWHNRADDGLARHLGCTRHPKGAAIAASILAQ